MKPWTKWRQLEGLDFTIVPETPGAYVIATRSAIHRAIGIDPDGVLHIGESDNLRSRIRAFWNCASQLGTQGHMAGWRYQTYRMNKHFPLNDLRVKWCATRTKKLAYALEGGRLKKYFADHLELPPLNLKFNWSEEK